MTLTLTLLAIGFTSFHRFISMTWVIMGHAFLQAYLINIYLYIFYYFIYIFAFAQAMQLASTSGRSVLPVVALMKYLYLYFDVDNVFCFSQ